MTRSRLRLRWLARGLGLALSLPALSLPAHAVASGGFSITGAVTFTTTGTDFLPSGIGTGTFLVEPLAPPSGSFTGLSNTTGLVLDFTTATAPVGAPFTLNNFITFAAAPTLQLHLTFINPGVFSSAQCGLSPAAGETCTPAGSAFNLVNTTATSSVLSFTMAGSATDGTLPVSPFQGTLTTQFTGSSFQQVLATLAGGGSVSAAYSADFLTTVQTAAADLSITKTDGVDVVQPGGTTTYTIVVANLGPSTAVAAPVTDVFPAAISAVSWSCTASPGSLCAAANGTGDLGTTVTLLAGGTATFVAIADLSASASGTLTNTATVGAAPAVSDPDASNNAATDVNAIQINVLEIPTLGWTGLLTLFLSLSSAAVLLLRRGTTKRATAPTPGG